jgi:hypothetical protein
LLTEVLHTSIKQADFTALLVAHWEGVFELGVALAEFVSAALLGLDALAPNFLTTSSNNPITTSTLGRHAHTRTRKKAEHKERKEKKRKEKKRKKGKKMQLTQG